MTWTQRWVSKLSSAAADLVTSAWLKSFV